MAEHDFDVVILGGGNAAMGVTVPTRAAGMSVAMIEDWDLGGTCPNRGCTPKKILVAAAHTLHEIEQASVHKIEVGKPTLDWAALIDREKEMISSLPGDFAGLMEKRGVRVFRARGRFTGPNEITAGSDVLRARHIVVATGSAHRHLPIPGNELMITSDDVLSERQQPDEVAFIGGGVVAFEFSHVYARAGTRVTILEALPRFLGNFDEDAVAAVCRETERLGVDIKSGVSVRHIERVNNRLSVTYIEHGEERAIEVDRVINGAGRVPNVADLDLESGEVEVDGSSIVTNEHFRSASNPAVWVGGDALSGKAQLSPIATHEGRMIGRMIAGGEKETLDYASIPSAVFTVPTMAAVGMTERHAREAGREVDVHSKDLTPWFSSRTHAASAGFSKIIVDGHTNRLLGAHLVGHNAGDLIHMFALALKHGITVTDLRSMVYAFPTYAADVPSML